MKQIAEHLYRLGDSLHPCFLLTGTAHSVLIDAGPAFMAPTYRRETELLLGRRTPPDWLLFTHFHYDHVGGAPYLLRHFPTMRTAGSAKLGRLLARGKIVAGLVQFNRTLAAEHHPDDEFADEDFQYGALSIDRHLSDGEVIELGGASIIEAITTPGHTPDNLCFFLPHAGAAITAEAVGIIPGDEFWVAPQFLSSYEDYLGSIDRIHRRRPKLLALGHHRVVTEKDIDRFFQAAIADCRQYRQMVVQLLQEEKMSEDRTVQRVFELLVRTGRRGGQPEAALLLNLNVQVKIIARQLRSRSGKDKEKRTYQGEELQ